MYRLSSQEGLGIRVHHARSLRRYSEGLLHCHHLLPDPLEERRRYRKDTILTVFFLFFVDSLCWTVFVPILPAFFRPQYGYVSIGMLLAMKPLAQCIMTSVSMVCVDSFGPKTPQLIGTFAMTIAMFMATMGFFLKNTFSFHHIFIILAIVRFVHGCSSAFISAGGLSHVTMCHPSPLHYHSAIVVRIGTVIGFLLGPLLGGYMVHTHGDLDSEHHENNKLWLLFALLLLMSGLSLVHQTVIFHNGHSIFISEYDESDGNSMSESVEIDLHSPIDNKISERDKELSTFRPSMLELLVFCITNSTLVTVLCTSFGIGLSFGSLELLIPLFLNEKFDYDPFLQSMAFVCIPTGYVFFSLCFGSTSGGEDGSKPLYAGIIGLCCGFFLFLIVAEYPALLEIDLVFIGGCLVITEMTILPTLNSIIEWLNVAAVLSAVQLSEVSCLLGIAVGPILSGGCSMALGGGVSGFYLAAAVVGSLLALCALIVGMHLRDIGRVAGEAAIDMDGSLFGKSALQNRTRRGSGSSGGGVSLHDAWANDRGSFNSTGEEDKMLRSSLLGESF